jgi:hypothetical protein
VTDQADRLTKLRRLDSELKTSRLLAALTALSAPGSRFSSPPLPAEPASADGSSMTIPSSEPRSSAEPPNLPMATSARSLPPPRSPPRRYEPTSKTPKPPTVASKPNLPSCGGKLGPSPLPKHRRRHRRPPQHRHRPNQPRAHRPARADAVRSQRGTGSPERRTQRSQRDQRGTHGTAQPRTVIRLHLWRTPVHDTSARSRTVASAATPETTVTTRPM